MADGAEDSNAPGMRQWLPLPWFGVLAHARRDPLHLLLDGFHTHGDVFRLQLGPMLFHQLAHPEHVKHVLVDHTRNYPRGWMYRRMRFAVGDGLVTTEGETWKRLRRMAQPAFHTQRVARLVQGMVEEISNLRQHWAVQAERGTPFDVAAEFVRLTLSIVGRALLGIDLNTQSDRLGAAFLVCMEYVEDRLGNPFALPPWIPTPGSRRFHAASLTIDTIIQELIAQRRARGTVDTANDLLSMLLAVRDEETGAGLTDRELRDQLYTFIAAGYETTALALGWTIYLLHEHPQAEERVRAEMIAVLDGRTPTLADLPRLTFTRRVIEESLRLYPPVFAVARGVVADDVIGGYRIPARSTVVLSPYVTHRHPGFWSNPEAFDPDRFAPERSAERPRFAWYPFLGGPHQCIGQEFAMMEATLALAMLLPTFHLELAPGARVEPWPLLGLRFRYGLWMTPRRLESTCGSAADPP